MKNLKLFVILFSFIITNLCFAQSDWFWQNPLPQGNNLTSVNYLSPNLMVAFSDAGTFMKSTEGGVNWELNNFVGGIGANNCSKSLSTSYFLNSTTGFAATGNIFYENGINNNRILKTTNSGITWDSVTLNTYPSFKTIFFIDNNTGWSCCSFTSTYSTNINRVLKTTNGGINWFIQDNTISAIYSIYFINPNTGWFTGYYELPYPVNSRAYYIYKTTDGGSTYFTQLLSNTFEEMKTIFFINENTGWAGGTKLRKTTNGGSIWISQDINANSIAFVNDQTGYCANNAAVLKTTNSGINWVVQSTAGGSSVSVLDDNKIICAGYNGRISKTNNGGINWILLSQSATSNVITNLHFVNANTGFCISHYWSYPPYPAAILKTTDKGIHWAFNFENTSNDMNDIFFIDDQTGWISGVNGLLYKTSNTGTNWTIQNSSTNLELFKIYFLNQNTGWILGYQCILKTTNSGLNWVKTDLTGQYLSNMKNSVKFVNENTGVIVGTGGIGKTTNGGLNWEQTFLYSMQDIDLDDQNNIYAISLQEFYKTSDLGSSWQLISSPWKASVELKMLNSTTGYMSCLRGNILKTTDGGNTWATKKLPTNVELRSIFVVDTNQCWVVGDGGLIMSTVGSGIITAFNNQSSVFIPKNFNLSQNYPNPFNPQTKIKFEIPANVKSQTSNVRLVIYDLLGRDVTTLVNEELKPGTYEADWDASNYSSGVYFYKIISNDFVETKKMVLMK